LAAETPLGVWTLASAPDIPAVIEAATASMNFVIRPIARGRLKKTNPVYRRIRIERSGAEYVFQYDERQIQRVPADGRAVDWKREDGEVLRLSVHPDHDDLVQTYQAKDGERTNLFHLDPAAHTLQLRVTVTSPRLPGPVAYTLAYQPASAE
jgi:hypothetical protein